MNWPLSAGDMREKPLGETGVGLECFLQNDLMVVPRKSKGSDEFHKVLFYCESFPHPPIPIPESLLAFTGVHSPHDILIFDKFKMKPKILTKFSQGKDPHFLLNAFTFGSCLGWIHFRWPLPGTSYTHTSTVLTRHCGTLSSLFISECLSVAQTHRGRDHSRLAHCCATCPHCSSTQHISKNHYICLTLLSFPSSSCNPRVYLVTSVSAENTLL